jgi:Zn-dependent M28 family amino/carboxypeptidase
VWKSYRDGKLVSGEGYAYQPGHTLAVPTIEMAQEDYRRLVRLAATGTAPQLSVAVAARYDDHKLEATNIVAEIPGSDPRAGVVMAGGHFDSWIAGDGASDNGAGSIAVIEAARLIHTLGLKPRRTIRIILWSGEEQGELGSMAYVSQHFAARPVDSTLTGFKYEDAWGKAFPITPRPEHAMLKAYFNVDNGSGKVRGIYTEGNTGAGAVLGEWLAPFKSLGASTLVASKTHGTDHEKYQAVGLPGYQFIQDPLDYESRVHHSTLDTLDHMRGDDMRQISVVLAGMVWQAANSDKELPRPPIPTQPSVTDPFKVADPDD